MLHEGRSALQGLLSAYAACLQTHTWPAFDGPPSASLDAWTEVHLGPWMIDPCQGGAGYFAATSTRTATAPLEETPAHSSDAP